MNNSFKKESFKNRVFFLDFNLKIKYLESLDSSEKIEHSEYREMIKTKEIIEARVCKN